MKTKLKSKEQIMAEAKEIVDFVSPLNNSEDPEATDKIVEYFASKYPELFVTGVSIAPTAMSRIIMASPPEMREQLLDKAYETMFDENGFKTKETLEKELDIKFDSPIIQPISIIN